MSNQYNLAGRVKFHGNATPIAELRLDFYDKSGLYGWIGGTRTDRNGDYLLVVEGEPATKLTDGQMALEVMIYRGDYLIRTQVLTTLSEMNIIEVSEEEYAAGQPSGGGNDDDGDDSSGGDGEDFFTLRGVIRAANGVAARDASVNVYASGFREGEGPMPASSTRTDAAGAYEVQVPYQLGARLYVKISPAGSNVVVASTQVIVTDREASLNLTLEGPAGVLKSSYDDVLDAAIAVGGLTATNLHSIQTDGGNASELRQLATIAGRTEDELSLLVQAHKRSVELDVPAPVIFALGYSGESLDKNSLLRINESAVRAAVQHAADAGTIPALSSGELNTAIDNLKSKRLEAARKWSIPSEETSLGEALDAAFGSEEATNDYLMRLRDFEGSDIQSFWSEYASQDGAIGNAQHGLQLLALTGFQPSLTANLRNVYGGIYTMAKWTVGEWENQIDNASVTNNPAIPKVIKNAHDDDASARRAYAVKLQEIAQSKYPLAGIARALEDNDNPKPLISDSTQRSRVKKFINEYPDFDFRRKTIHDITDAQVTVVTGATGGGLAVAKENLKEALAPFQRLTRITGGKTEAIAALKKDELDSAQAIIEISADDFAAKYATELGGAEATKSAYQHAQKVAATATQAAVSYRGRADATSRIWALGGEPNGPMASPELRTMFGALETCGCEHCLSVFSPSAYFVDVQSFLKKHSDAAYNELDRRRPDLKKIDLTCKNANTPLPYVDLVLELLESLAVKTLQQGSNNPYIPESYQTAGKAEDLAAYPEHVYRNDDDVYVDNQHYDRAYNEILKAALYPTNLPFNLALEESRIYAKHLGYTREELMTLFRPVELPQNLLPGGGTNDAITDYTLLTESIGISKEVADIVTGQNNAATWAFYGLKEAVVTANHGLISPADSSVYLVGYWGDVLRGDAASSADPDKPFGGIDALIQKLEISFKELMQLLKTDFLNSVKALPNNVTERQVEIVARLGKPPDTCVLKDLRLEVTLQTGESQQAFDEAFFGKLHRFVRLWRASGIGIYELDALLLSFGTTGVSTNLNLETYCNVARAIKLAKKLDTTPQALATWWSPLDTRRYPDLSSPRAELQPSYYDTLYNNKSVLNPPDPAFADTDFGLPQAVNYEDHTAAILAATGLKEEQLLALMRALNINAPASAAVTLDDLSRIQAGALIVKQSRLDVDDLTRIGMLADVDLADPLPGPFSTTSDYALRLLKLETLLDTSASLAETKLTLVELDYALKDDVVTGLVPTNETIHKFYEQLVRDVKKAVAEIVSIANPTTDEKSLLANTVRQQLAAHFALDSATAKYLAEKLQVQLGGSSLPADQAFISEDFASYSPETDSPAFIAGLRAFYHRMAKAAWWVKRMKLSAADLETMYETAASLGVWLPDTLAVGNTTPLPERLQSILRHARWIMVRDRLAVSVAAWNNLVETVADTTSKQNWMNTVQAATAWPQEDIETLVGDANATSAAGLLNVNFPNDFREPALLISIGGIQAAADRVGLTPAQIAKVLRADLRVQDSQAILKAAKAKHSDKAWLKLAKPLRDVLREKQRAALVAWAVANPTTDQKWRTAAELYAYLLIDPEMSPCMKTSRTKQAIASVQLFMDRMLLNLESEPGNPAQLLSIPTNAVAQWKTWRKWYRIWEANRKVFLYPENWIEPELRDDKTPFFRELETTLLQDEVTAGKVEDAYLEYLEKLDGVGRLEPVTAYHETEDGADILHVVARTLSQPHIYHYRRLEHDEWTAWERMNIAK